MNYFAASDGARRRSNVGWSGPPLGSLAPTSLRRDRRLDRLAPRRAVVERSKLPPLESVHFAADRKPRALTREAIGVRLCPQQPPTSYVGSCEPDPCENPLPPSAPPLRPSRAATRARFRPARNWSPSLAAAPERREAAGRVTKRDIARAFGVRGEARRSSSAVEDLQARRSHRAPPKALAFGDACRLLSSPTSPSATGTAS